MDRMTPEKMTVICNIQAMATKIGNLNLIGTFLQLENTPLDELREMQDNMITEYNNSLT